MAVSDLTGTKWVLNSTISGNNFAVMFNINFISNGNNYSVFHPSFVDILGEHNLYYGNPNEISVYYDGTWEDQAYRILSITDGTDATNSDLIAWLEANATQVPVADLSGTEWVINNEPNLSNLEGGQASYNINFVSNSTNYNVIILQRSTAIRYSSNGSVVVAYQLSTPPIEEGGIN